MSNSLRSPEGSGRRLAIEAILFCSYAAFSVSWMAISPLAPSLMEWFHVTKVQFALLNTVVTLSKVVAPIAAGAMALRIGLKNTILIGSFFVCLSVVGPVFPSFAAFIASRALFGIGGAVLVTLTPAMVMQWFPREDLAVVNGINGVAANTGFALALSLTVPLSRTALGWRGTLIAFGLASAALFLAWAVVGKENNSGAGAADGQASRRPVRYLDVWSMKETWLITLAFTGPVALYLTLALWLPTHYRERFGFDIAQGARYCSILLYSGIPSAIVSGLLVRRLGVRRPFLVAGGILAGTSAFGTFLSPSPSVIVASSVLLGVGLFIPTAALMTLLMELKGATPRHVALIAGTMVSVCYALNSFIPNFVGWLSDKTGSFVPGFIGLVAFSWVVVLSGLLLPETGPRASRPGGAELREPDKVPA